MRVGRLGEQGALEVEGDVLGAGVALGVVEGERRVGGEVADQRALVRGEAGARPAQPCEMQHAEGAAAGGQRDHQQAVRAEGAEGGRIGAVPGLGGGRRRGEQVDAHRPAGAEGLGGGGAEPVADALAGLGQARGVGGEPRR